MLETKTPELASFNVTRQVRMVDTDATGQVHFAAYVRMMEEAEYAFLRSRGLSVVLRDDRGVIGFPRLQAKLEIHQPLTFDELVTVQLSLVQLDGKQIAYRFQIVNPSQQVAVEGYFRSVCCRFPDHQPPFAILMPEFVLQALSPAESNGN